MPTYVAMLRGINVGGHKKVAMDKLRTMFEALGFEYVETYIQSGNVVFSGTKSSSSNLAKKIGDQILEVFGFPVSVIIRTAEEMGKLIQDNPFLKAKEIDSSKLHVTFLSEAPTKNALKQFEALAVAPDQFRNSEREIYLYCPNGYGTTKLSNNTFEKLLATTATTRNWNTVNKLYAMAKDSK